MPAVCRLGNGGNVPARSPSSSSGGGSDLEGANAWSAACGGRTAASSACSAARFSRPGPPFSPSPSATRGPRVGARLVGAIRVGLRVIAVSSVGAIG